MEYDNNKRKSLERHTEDIKMTYKVQKEDKSDIKDTY